MTPEKKVIPFSNGSEASAWQASNCHKCPKYENKSTKREKAKCKEAYDIDLGFILGEIPFESAQKIGCSDSGHINQPCKLKP